MGGRGTARSLGDSTPQTYSVLDLVLCCWPACSPALCTAASKYLLLALEVVVVIPRLLRSSTILLGRLPSSLGMLCSAFLGLRASLSLRVLLVSR